MSELRKIPRPIYFRYILLNIPEFAVLILILIVIQFWVVIPVWLLGSVIAFWIVKDACLFRFVWRAYDWDRPGQSGKIIGEQGIAIDRLAPYGYVRIGAERWRAEKIGQGPPIEEGQRVRVEKVEGLTVFVVPWKTENRQPRTEAAGPGRRSADRGLKRGLD